MRRLFDILCAAAGLLVIWPVLALIAALIAIADGRPVFFRQERVGAGGRRFRIWKFRTMLAGPTNQGSLITAAGDARVTAIGRWLRRFKLDELPQLFNVLAGDMSVIGPRPEVPKYVEPGSPVWNEVLRVRPGITDLATLLYRNEEALLAASANPETFYRETVLPSKLALNLCYLRSRSWASDAKLILLTIQCSLAPGRFDQRRVETRFARELGFGGAGSQPGCPPGGASQAALGVSTHD